MPSIVSPIIAPMPGAGPHVSRTRRDAHQQLADLLQRGGVPLLRVASQHRRSGGLRRPCRMCGGTGGRAGSGQLTAARVPAPIEFGLCSQRRGNGRRRGRGVVVLVLSAHKSPGLSSPSDMARPFTARQEPPSDIHVRGYGPLEISPSALAAALPRAVRYRLGKFLLVLSTTALPIRASVGRCTSFRPYPRAPRSPGHAVAVGRQRRQ